MTDVTKLAIGSVLVGIVVVGLKFLAFHLTGSVALLSDALESIVNIAAAIAVLVAVQVSAIPADSNHPYGHHKAEYFAAVFEGVLIVVAALLIFRESYLAIVNPRAIEAPLHGLLVNGLATTINGIWCVVLLRAGRRRRSPALIADAKHILTDVVTSVGVWVGLILVTLTGWLILDPIVACLVALNIIWSGWLLIRDSIGGLMDAAPDEKEIAKIKSTIAAHGGGAIEAHDLRTRHAGRVTFIQFHLVVSGQMSVSKAHDICDRIERAIQSDIAGAVVTIHVEPDNKAKHHDPGAPNANGSPKADPSGGAGGGDRPSVHTV